MTDGDGFRLCPIRCDAVAARNQRAIADLLAYFDPDVVTVLPESRDMRIVSRLERGFDGPVLTVERGPDAVRTVEREGVRLAVADTLDALTEAPALVDPEPADTTVVVCDEIQPETDPVRLDAELSHRESLVRLQHHSAGDTVFATGGFEADYEHEWPAAPGSEGDSLTVRGLAPIRRAGEPELPCLSIATDGRISLRSAPADRFGLQAIDGVGPTQRERLAANGYDSRSDVSAADVAELAGLPGVGESTARRMRDSARAIDEGTVVRTTDASVPPAEGSPVFLDIETDGLHPTVIWLIGVYDPGRDVYTDFLDASPSLSDPGEATRAFVSWLAAEYDRVSLVTWNGHEFDFPHLREFVARHAPAYVEYWEESIREYDLYAWARENAALPGRTNRLDAVARALGVGREGAAASVDGAGLARAIRRRLHAPERETDIDWERARAYCRADVMELAAVYEEIAATAPAGDRSEAATTTQSGLGEFSE